MGKPGIDRKAGFRMRLARTIGALCLCLAGCGTPMRSVTFQVLQSVEQEDGSIGAAPVKGAHVKTEPVALHAIPLPVSSEHLRQAEISNGPGGFTDEAGKVRLKLSKIDPYLVQVDPPMFGALAEVSYRRYVLDRGAVVLRADSASESESASPLTLIVVDSR